MVGGCSGLSRRRPVEVTILALKRSHEAEPSGISHKVDSKANMGKIES